MLAIGAGLVFIWYNGENKKDPSFKVAWELVENSEELKQELGGPLKVRDHLLIT